MSFISRFITRLLSRKEKSKLKIEFGKYTEKFDHPDYEKKWNLAQDLYRKGSVIEAYAVLFDFLTDPERKNLEYVKSNHKLEFSFYQGSKKVVGLITDFEISAEAQVAQFDGELPPNLLELLLQENFKLRFSRFVRAQNTLSLKYDAPVKITSPEDLYQALRELAIFADSYDDILVDRYASLKPVNIQHIMPLSEEEVRVKIDFIRSWTKHTLNQTDKLTKDKYSREHNKGLVSYLLLSLIYKIYYLIAPEGVLLDFLKQLDKMYWQTSESILQKNDYIISALQNLYNQSDEYFKRSLYRVISTFSVVQPVKPAKIVDFVSSELEKINWIKSQNPEIYVRACEYIIGYLNFHIALSPGLKHLLNVLWRVFNDDYFIALGYSLNFLSRGKLNSFAIEFHINKVLSQYQLKGFRTSKLVYSSLPEFAKSFLQEFINFLRNE